MTVATYAQCLSSCLSLSLNLSQARRCSPLSSRAPYLCVAQTLALAFMHLNSRARALARSLRLRRSYARSARVRDIAHERYATSARVCARAPSSLRYASTQALGGSQCSPGHWLPALCLRAPSESSRRRRAKLDKVEARDSHSETRRRRRDVNAQCGGAAVMSFPSLASRQLVHCRSRQVVRASGGVSSGAESESEREESGERRQVTKSGSNMRVVMSGFVCKAVRLFAEITVGF